MTACAMYSLAAFVFGIGATLLVLKMTDRF